MSMGSGPESIVRSATPRSGFTYRRQVTLIALITAATLITAMVSFTWLQRQMVAASGETISIMATEIAAKLDLLMNERAGDIRIISETIAMNGTTAAERQHLLRAFHQAYPLYLWIGVTDAAGRIVESLNASTRGLDVKGTSWFQAVQQGGGEMYIGDIQYDEVSGSHEAVSFTAPIVDHRTDARNRPFRGVVSTRVDAARLEQLVTDAIQLFQKRTSFFHTVEYQVLREDGTVFIDSDSLHAGKMNLAKSGLPSVRHARSGESGFVEEAHLRRGVPVLTGYARTHGQGDVNGPRWTVLLRVERAEVVAPVQHFLWTVGTAGLVMIGPLIGLLVQATRRAQVEWLEAQDERIRSRENEHRLQTILEVEPEGVLVIGADRRVLQVNPAGCALFDAGFPEEILGRNVADFIHADDRRAYEEAHAAALQGRGVLNKGRLTGLSGQSRWFEMTSVPLPAEDGAVSSVLSVVRDITEPKHAERRQALQHAVAKVLAEASTVEQALPDLLRVIGASSEWEVGVFWQVNNQTKTLACVHTWGVDSVLSETFFTASRQETFSSGVGFPGRCWERGEPFWAADVTQEPDFVRTAAASVAGLHSGCAFPVWLRASVYGVMEFYCRETQTRDADLLRTLGTIGSQIGLFLERAEVEAALRENESRTRLIIDTALDGVVTMDAQGHITEWNAQAEQLFGWPAHEAIGRDLAETIIPKAQRSAHREGISRYLQTGENRMMGRLVELQAQHRDGRVFPVELSIAPLQLDDTVVFSAFIRDISRRKESELALSSYARQLEQSNHNLDEALAQAQAATEAKSAFLATMSHEIRTPMNGVIGMTGLLLDTELTAEQREYADVVRNCGDHLLTLINDILDFSKIEAGKMSLEIIDFDLRHAVEDALDLLSERASSKQLNLACLFHAEVPSALRGDPGRVRQVVTNLVGNAIKFTERGDVVVQVQLVSQEDGAVVVRFEVTDTGIGISEDHQQLLFQAFSQADGSTTRKYGGTGLGLVICKRLVEMMRGEIGVRSQPGAGSTFWFTVRFEVQPVQPALSVPEAASLQGRRILIVDDKPINCRILELLTKKWGMVPTVLVETRGALEHVREQGERGDPYQYDVVMLDIDLAALDGLELARMLAGTEPAPRLVVLTSVGRRGDARAAKAMGISAYLTKPVRESQLARCLATVLEQPRPVAGEGPVPEGQELVTRHTLAEASVGTGKKILLAEDNLINQKVAVRMFERLGYRVDVVANGLEAVEALSRIPYDMVFMDCQMPEMDGFDATREIRRREAGDKEQEAADSGASGLRPRAARRVPIIAMTGNAMQGDRERCLQAGMDDYVPKPITSEVLAAVFERWRWTDAGLPPGASLPSIDPLIFGGLRELTDDDDPGVPVRLLRHFVADTPTRLATLGTACRQGRAEDVRRIAQRLKGRAAHLGLTGIARVSERVALMAARDLAGVPALLTELELEFQRVRRQVEQDLKEAV
ncbi:MAG: PAS domain S-box protein [Nitrospira sp.]|nr:PAS domain S-box protein [Nitrospira sp.]